MKIWERYFLSQTIKTFLLLIGIFFALYILIDYSSRITTYQRSGLSFPVMSSYYFWTLIQRIDILVPFAFGLALIRTLLHLNIHRELIALWSSGVSTKRLLLPFFLFSLMLTALLYLNNEFLLPGATQKINQLKDGRFKERYKADLGQNIHPITLTDGSELLYHGYDTAQKRLYDVYWIASPSHIFHMEYLEPFLSIPEGQKVNEFKRVEESLKRLSFHERRSFENFPLNETLLHEALKNPKEESISYLLQEPFSSLPKNQAARFKTALYHKAAMPWLSLLVLLSVAPFCVRFGRQTPTFFIVLLSMVGIVTFYLVMNAATVAGENQVLPPSLAIALPFLLYGIPFGWGFKEMQ